MLKKAFRIFYTVNIILFIALGSATFLMLFNNRMLVESNSARNEALAAVDEIRSNYVNMTIYLQYYAITGEEIWLDKYDELLQITIGERPGPDNKMKNWENRLKDFIFQGDQYYLEKSEQRWKEQLVQEKKILKEDTGEIINFLFSDTYRAYIALTLNPLDDFIMRLESRTRIRQDTLEGYSRLILSVTVVVVILCVIVNWTFLFLLSKKILNPVFMLKDTFKKASEGDLKVFAPVIGNDEIAQLSSSFNKMVSKINTLFEQTVEEHNARRKAELQVMQSQIKPHFIYNTLEAIIITAENEEYNEVVNLVTALSELFKVTLSQGREWIQLKEELSHVRSYLEIQKTRYQDILDYEIIVEEEIDIDNIEILKLIIQPLVENSIYHGIKHKRLKGFITVKVGLVSDREFNISVSDTGIGLSAEGLNSIITGLDGEECDGSKGFGLRNVHKRLKFCYGREYGLKINSEYQKGTEVSLTLPLKGRVE